MVLPISPQTARQLLDQLLDKGYARATDRVIRALVEVPKRGVLAKRLYDLEQEARRLSRADERLDPRNPVYLALLRDLDPALQHAARLVDAAGVDVQEAGITAGAEGARRLTGASYLGLHWNVPDPEAVARLVNYTGKSAWAGAVGDYPKAIIQTINRLALRNFLAGMNPLQSSRLIRQQVENLPAATANNLLRTLQLTVYRDSTAESYKANADILDGQIRLANLDTRCCMACVVLHGTELSVGERVDDHHQGRCTSIGKLKGRRYDIETGVHWFARQPPERQQALMGKAAFRAWQDGTINLTQFVGHYNDPIFGRMVRENSLKGMIGDSAKRYYSFGGAAAVTPSRQSVPTMEGWVKADVGTPGSTLDSLKAFLQTSEGPLAGMFNDFDMALINLDFDTGSYSISPSNVQDAAKRFVAEARDVQYGRSYLLKMVGDMARDNGVNLTPDQVEAMYNDHYRRQSQAILTAAQIGKVRLTEPQTRRLLMAADGKYTDMVYTAGEFGKLDKPTQHSYGNGMSRAERDQRRRDFLSMINDWGE